MLWINEGFVLDDAGNMIQTSYVDLRAPGGRTHVQTLVRGCRREHALEDSETVLISPVKRFREEGHNLIRDPQEGLAEEVTEMTQPETPEEALERRRVAQTNEATELLNSELRIRRRVQSQRVERTSKSLTFGKHWWILSTTITPETEEEWAAWRATLDPAYDHESTIGQPAKFAQALGRMVTEQQGPQSRDARLRSSIAGGDTVQRTLPAQWILHGPVVYADGLYDTLTRDVDPATEFAASVFMKSATHAAQREYRFAVLCDGIVDRVVPLTISGMMRDSLRPTRSGLVRPTPKPVDESASETARTSSSQGATRKLLYHRHTTKERVAQRSASRVEMRRADGRVLSSESDEREVVQEKSETRDWSAGEHDGHETEMPGRSNEDDSLSQGEQPLLQQGQTSESGTTDEDAVSEIALEEAASCDRDVRTGEGIPVLHGGTGRAYQSLEEMFSDMLEDPAFPMGPASEPWAEEALRPEEVLAIYRMVAMLAHKVTHVSLQHREAASSACWHAIQCIRDIYVRLGDIVDTVAIERDRFVVLRIKKSPELRAEGRIGVAPTGVYAYCLKRPGATSVGHGEGEFGRLSFPSGSALETFESFGWSPKESTPRGR